MIVCTECVESFSCGCKISLPIRNGLVFESSQNPFMFYGYDIFVHQIVQDEMELDFWCVQRTSS